MIYKDIEFTLTAIAAGIWSWQFKIGDRIFTGKTEARLHLLAVRRVQMRIDRELKKRRTNNPSIPRSRPDP